jgi:hypothetical protein
MRFLTWTGTNPTSGGGGPNTSVGRDSDDVIADQGTTFTTIADFAQKSAVFERFGP